MAKKNFKSGFDALLSDEVIPQTPLPDKDRWVKTTCFIPEEIHNKIKHLSYWERKSIKDIITGALEKHLKEYESEKGEILPPQS